MSDSFAILVPILGILVGMLAVAGNIFLRHQKLKLDAGGPGSLMHEETLRELHSLKQRVAVLERLLTDDDRKLAAEIERLRGEQASPRA